MQGFPESPHLVEKHIDKILHDVGLTPTVHEPCLYSGTIEGERVLICRMVEYFAISTFLDRTSNILLDCLDGHLSIPIKHQVRIPMYNGLHIHHTSDYIKLTCETYIDKMCAEHKKTWMTGTHISAD